MDLCDDCRIDSNVAARRLRDAVLLYNNTPIDMQAINSALNEAESYVNELDTSLAELQSTCPKGNEALLSDYVTKVQKWESIAKSILSQVRNGNIQEAAKSLTEDCSPSLNEVATAAGSLGTALDTAKEDMLKTQDRNSTIAMIIIVVAMVIATLIVVRIALIIIKSIVEPAEQVHNALSGFSEGKLDVPVNYESTSELGDMCNALRTSQHVLSEVISDTCRLLEEMGAGNFDVRTKDEKM